MLNQKNYLMAITVAGIATLNIAAPVFAANQIVLNHPGSGKEYIIPLTALDQLAKTGNKSVFPPDLFQFFSSQISPDNFQQQLNAVIKIDPKSPLDPFEETLLNNLIPPNSTEAVRQTALTLMAAKCNGHILIDFLKTLPVETITTKNFLEVLTAYQVPPIKPPTPEPNPPETIPAEPVPEPNPSETIPAEPDPEPASTLGLLGFSIWAFIKKQKL